jgi:hypothetical protein
LSYTFDSVPFSVFDIDEYGYQINATVKKLLTSEDFVQLSTVTKPFPQSFECYTTDKTEITNLAAKIGVFGSLVVGSTTYTNCYISELSGIKEVIAGSGKYTYKIGFGKADKY